ncbi:MAG: hypothetical protein INR73_24035 [Williamsia sp.]|nr:hypothetical protein [Williamsia sp.]
MAENIVEQIQKNLGFPPLHKIDPNTQEVKHGENRPEAKTLAQAAIPAVLLGLYRYGSTEQGANEILHGQRTSDWLNIFYDEKKEETIQKVASYGHTSLDETTQTMESIGAEAIKIIKQHLIAGSGFAQVKDYITQQRKNILVYLPAELQLGYLVNDNTLDDRTNKMEGPMSNSMHFIERIFSGSTTEKNELSPEE